jgi:imidazolonepropionase-like amidohydrolase
MHPLVILAAIVLRGATVLPQDGPAIPNADVVIEGDRIVAVGARGTVKIPAGAEVVDDSGKWIVPGLIDLHAHVASDQIFPELFVAHGVTTVRDMGNRLELVRPLRDAILAGKHTGPEILYVGPILDGEPPVWPPISEVVTDPKEVPALLARLKAAGVCGFKVYERLDPAVYDAIVAEAKKLGVPVVGHVPERVGAQRAIDAGQATIEHLSHFPAALAKSATEWGMLGEVTGWGELDEEKEKALIARLVANKTRLDPTQLVIENISAALRGVDLEMRHEELVPRALKDTFWKALSSAVRADEVTDKQHRRALARRLEFVKRAKAAGVPILVGSDTPNPHVVPGASIAAEIELLAKALGPEEALRAATLANADALGRSDLGRVKAGARADLVVLDRDPRKDPSGLGAPVRVVLRGTAIDPRALLAQIADDVKKLDARPATGFEAIAGELSKEKPRGPELKLEGGIGGFGASFWARAGAFELEDGGVDRRMRSAVAVPLPAIVEESLVLDPSGKPRTWTFRRDMMGTLEVSVLLSSKGAQVVLPTPSGPLRVDVGANEVVSINGGLLVFDAIARLHLAEGAKAELAVRKVDVDRRIVMDKVTWTVQREKLPEAPDARRRGTRYSIEADGEGGGVRELEVWLDERSLPIGLRVMTAFGPFEAKPVAAAKKFY